MRIVQQLIRQTPRHKITLSHRNRMELQMPADKTIAIAKAVGVTPGAIYAHFSAKHDLLAAVYRTGVARVAAAIEAAPSRAEDPWRRLEAVCAAHLAALTGPDPYAKVVIRVLPADAPEVERALIHLRDGYEARFRAVTRTLELDRELDPGLFRLFLLGALNWTQTWYRPGAAEIPVIARQLVATLRDGGERRQEDAT